jgi:sirohydrochlorin cobaltochelatase
VAGALPLTKLKAIAMTSGLILFAHGARDPRWAKPFEAVADRVRAQQPTVAVRLAYLELMTPDLPTAAADLVATGCDSVTVLPLFLGAGGHVRRDLPAIIDGLRASYPQVRWHQPPPVGELPAVIDAIAAAALAALGHDNDTNPAQPSP